MITTPIHESPQARSLTHPGLSLRDDLLPLLGLSVTEAARQMQVSRITLSRFINGRSSMTVDMALRLEGLGLGNAEDWLTQQVIYDVRQARNRIS